MGSYVLDFHDIDQTQVAFVGGKGARLGELSRIEGIRVPPGFCVTTDAFQRILADAPSIDDRLDRLARCKPDDTETIRALSAEIRRDVEGTAIPKDLGSAIMRPLVRLGEQAAYAVRSSATAEDMPTASFAGQHDTYLNIVGWAAILLSISFRPTSSPTAQPSSAGLQVQPGAATAAWRDKACRSEAAEHLTISVRLLRHATVGGVRDKFEIAVQPGAFVGHCAWVSCAAVFRRLLKVTLSTSA